MIKKETKQPRILIVTPEVTYLPEQMGLFSSYLTAKAGGLADVSASLVNALFKEGADVHVAIPDYRTLFNKNLAMLSEIDSYELEFRKVMPNDRVHLAKDRAFYYLNNVYSYSGQENIKISLAFQREVINNIVPKIRPDLIHCNDWTTALIPAMARYLHIPCLFTIHNIHTVKCTLENIEDVGIDAAPFWHQLFYTKRPYSYEETRSSNPVDFLSSGIFAAHFVNTVSPTFLKEIIEGRHNNIEPSIRHEIRNKVDAGCAVGILNAPDVKFNPSTDDLLPFKYTPENHADVKKQNKKAFQRLMGLIEDENAPMFFWPSRLDPIQKGCQLLAEILYIFISKYWHQNLQVVFIADGPYQNIFHDIVNFHGLHNRVSVKSFRAELEHMAYGASDFLMMPSSFEPCGLPQMTGSIYGTLPVVHDTGGLHDTVQHLDINTDSGNGFIFKDHNSNGLLWALEEAMRFYNLPEPIRKKQITRIMTESSLRFNHYVSAREYISLYENMLNRPLVN